MEINEILIIIYLSSIIKCMEINEIERVDDPGRVVAGKKHC